MPNDSLRKRWQKSVNADLIPLPPAPTWKDLPENVRIPYAMTDAVAHLAVHQTLYPRLAREGLRQVYEIDRGVLPVLLQMEEVGMAVDVKELRRLQEVFADDFTRVCSQINKLAGRPLNPLSGDQVSDCLFMELGIEPTRLTKGGTHYTTADKYLKARKAQHEIIPLILEARQLNKYRGTYVEKLPDMLRLGNDGIWRYHPQWKYTRTATGRLAEEIIVLIPKHDPLAKEQHRENRAKAIRNCFYAREGHRLVSVDLSQIELRVMAHLSRDRKMLRAYDRGEDLHEQTAHELLGAPKGKENQDESKHRLPAKTMNFGIINGMTEFGMLDQLHEGGQLQWDIDSVREFRDDWFKVYSGVDQFWEERKAEARATGCVRSMFGRRRELSGIWSNNEQIQREAERQCLFPIQSSADEISKIWNRKIWRESVKPRAATARYCAFWTRIHDDTTLEADERIARTIRQEMLALVPDLLRIPTKAEGKIGQRWGEL